MSEKALLLKTIDDPAFEMFEGAGIETAKFDSSINPNEMLNRLEGVDLLGVRTSPKVHADVIDHLPVAELPLNDEKKRPTQLQAIGVYSAGIDSIDMDAATRRGLAVFNSPFANNNAVAEWVIGSIFSLARNLHVHNSNMHDGQWIKTAEGSREVTKGTLGILGKGGIGDITREKAKAVGMRVMFYDRQEIPARGAQAANSIEELLTESDYLTIHINGSPEEPIIGAKEIALMKPGAVLLNSSRAAAVDYDALFEAVQDNRLKGAALDVHPDEPASSRADFDSRFTDDPRFLLTPHIAGSTLESLEDAAISVTGKLLAYDTLGSTIGAVNLPNVAASPRQDDNLRITYLHRDESGALADFYGVINGEGLNVTSSSPLKTENGLGYMYVDVKSTEVGSRVEVDELQVVLGGALKNLVRVRII